MAEEHAGAAADSHDLIRVQGARVNNLKDVSVEIPKRRLTVFTGVSGSGKSSLVFGTIAAESQRLINETYSAFVQGFMPSMARPDVDVLDGLTTAIIVDQERMGANARSTVGTATDANAMLRILFSKLGKPNIGGPNAYSFNTATVSAAGSITVKGETKRVTFNRTGGMCPRCEGMGRVEDIDLAQLYDETKSINEGAITIPGYSMEGWYGRIFRGCGLLRRRQADQEVHQEGTRRPPLQGADQDQGRGHQPHLRGPGPADPEVVPVQGHRRAAAAHPRVRRSGDDVPARVPSATARGSARRRARPRSASVNIADACAMQITDLAEWVRGLKEPSVAPLLAKLPHTLDSFVEIGLGYLSLERPAGTLSGGEAQRTKMIRHLGSSLTDVTYVFDEPTIGLHPHDIAAHERSAAAAARQGQHGARRRAQARDDRDRRPRRRPRARRRHRRRHRLLTRARSTGLRKSKTHHRPPPRRPGVAQGDGAHAHRALEIRGADGQQPAEGRRRHPARRAVRDHRRRRLGQELARARLDSRPTEGVVADRPGRDPRLAAQQPGDLHRAARADPQGVRARPTT